MSEGGCLTYDLLIDLTRFLHWQGRGASILTDSARWLYAFLMKTTRHCRKNSRRHSGSTTRKVIFLRFARQKLCPRFMDTVEGVYRSSKSLCDLRTIRSSLVSTTKMDSGQAGLGPAPLRPPGAAR